MFLVPVSLITCDRGSDSCCFRDVHGGGGVWAALLLWSGKGDQHIGAREECLWWIPSAPSSYELR